MKRIEIVKFLKSNVMVKELKNEEKAIFVYVTGLQNKNYDEHSYSHRNARFSILANERMEYFIGDKIILQDKYLKLYSNMGIKKIMYNQINRINLFTIESEPEQMKEYGLRIGEYESEDEPKSTSEYGLHIGGGE